MISIDIQTTDNYFLNNYQCSSTKTNKNEKLLNISIAFDPIVITPSHEENVFEE